MLSQTLPAPATQLFRYLFEQASLGIAVEDLDGRILLSNPARGTLTIESQAKSGTTIHVTVPLRSDAAPLREAG